MGVLLQLLSAVGTKSSVPDTVFAAIGALANALEDDFIKYMDAFTPFLYNALGNQEEPALCSMAIGLVSDITRSLGEKVQPWCDAFMNYLLNNLRVSAFLARHWRFANLATEPIPWQYVQAGYSPMLWRYRTIHRRTFRHLSSCRCPSAPAS